LIVGATAYADSALMWLGQITNRTLVLPAVMFFPTSRCNSRCTTCDWFFASRSDLTPPAGFALH
jgi:hypothetical protein